MSLSSSGHACGPRRALIRRLSARFRPWFARQDPAHSPALPRWHARASCPTSRLCWMFARVLLVPICRETCHELGPASAGRTAWPSYGRPDWRLRSHFGAVRSATGAVPGRGVYPFCSHREPAGRMAKRSAGGARGLIAEPIPRCTAMRPPPPKLHRHSDGGARRRTLPGTSSSACHELDVFTGHWRAAAMAGYWEEKHANTSSAAPASLLRKWTAVLWEWYDAWIEIVPVHPERIAVGGRVHESEGIPLLPELCLTGQGGAHAPRPRVGATARDGGTPGRSFGRKEPSAAERSAVAGGGRTPRWQPMAVVGAHRTVQPWGRDLARKRVLASRNRVRVRQKGALAARHGQTEGPLAPHRAQDRPRRN